MKRINIIKFNAFHMVIYGFLGAILLGTFTLMLPVCSAKGEWTDFLTALFTATTSTCVTGLVVVPTYAYWSMVGKLVILILIQLGGLGIICIVTGFFLLIRRRISLRERRLIQESYNFQSGKGIVKHIKSIFFITFVIESIGTLLYSVSFIPKYGIAKGLGYSIFHSVSAFCNAGIDILGGDSLISFQGDLLVNVTTIFLIVCGGLGFIVFWDILNVYNKIRNKELSANKFFERLSLHTKLVLVSTLLLIIGGTLLTFIFEYNNPETLGQLAFGDKILVSLFQSVTLRTAGFCTINQVGFRNASVIIFCIMMFIGGSPIGTAGGVKTTTVALIVCEVKSFIRGKNDAEIFKRKLNKENIKTALSVVSVSFMVLLISIIVLSITENASLKQIVFEAFSAIGTVGISMNFTASLSTIGKIIIITLMFFGRVGPITMAMALTKKRKVDMHLKELPEKKIVIG